MGERAEIISMQGPTIGSWNFCIVKGKSAKPGTYEVYIPSAPEGKRLFPDIPAKFMRKDKPDAVSAAIASQAEALAAQLKAQLQGKSMQGKSSGAPRLATQQEKNVQMVKWLMERGLVPGAKGNKPGPSLAAEKDADTAGGLAKLLNSMASWTPPPITSPQEEMKQWLNSSGNVLPPETMAKLEATASQLSQERPQQEEVLELKAASPMAVLKTMAKEEEMMDLMIDPVINGTWDLGSGGRAFSIHNRSCTMFFEGNLAAKGEHLQGVMRQEGEWLVANLMDHSGSPGGTVRVQRGEEPGTAIVGFRNTEAQRMFGQSDWSGDVLARRTARTQDTFPGKCNFKTYGCWCQNGFLRLPDIFGGSVGDEVEVFKADGSGWYRCTILGFNRTTSLYTIFVPEGPANARVIADLPSDTLRHIPAPPPAPIKEQLELPAEHANLHLKANLPKPRTSARQEEQTPVKTSRQSEQTLATPARRQEIQTEASARLAEAQKAQREANEVIAEIEASIE